MTGNFKFFYYDYESLGLLLEWVAKYPKGKGIKPVEIELESKLVHTDDE